MNVNVQQLVGALCVTFEDGEKLHAAYRPAFDRGEAIFLDFAGTRIFVSQFFNAAVGQLLKEHDVAEVRQRLKLWRLDGRQLRGTGADGGLAHRYSEARGSLLR